MAGEGIPAILTGIFIISGAPISIGGYVTMPGIGYIKLCMGTMPGGALRGGIERGGRRFISSSSG